MEYKKVIWHLADICRGQLESRDAIDIISTVIACAALDKEQFSMISNMGSHSVKDALESIIHEAGSEYPLYSEAFQDAFLLSRLEDRKLAEIVYQVSNFSELKPFAESIRDVLVNALGMKAGDFSASDYISKLVPAIVGNAHELRLLDATSGLARTASNICTAETTLQEINFSTVSLAKRLFIIEGKEQEVLRGDSLLEPKWGEKKFDLVVMQPPFSVRFDPQSCLNMEDMPYLFIKNKGVPRTGGDAVWIQFVIHQLNDSGKAYLVLPQGSLFRGGYDGLVRDYLLDHELVESVVALPPGCLPHTGIALVLLVLSKGKAKGSPIRMVDLSDIGSRDRSGVKLNEEELEYAVSLANGKIDEADKTLEISVREIRQTTGNLLNVTRYIRTEEEIELPSVEEKMKELEQATTTYQKLQTELQALINK